MKAIFDPANYVQCEVDTLKAWEMIKPYVKYLHIKDALADGASEESLQKLAQIQENICSAAYYEEAITDILADETSYLFAGARTVEETAERIDQRVQLYLTEQWG